MHPEAMKFFGKIVPENDVKEEPTETTFDIDPPVMDYVDNVEGDKKYYDEFEVEYEDQHDSREDMKVDDEGNIVR